jgi:hypothetical protein
MQPLDTAFCAVEMLHVHQFFLDSAFSPQHQLSVSSTAMHAAASPVHHLLIAMLSTLCASCGDEKAAA